LILLRDVLAFLRENIRRHKTTDDKKIQHLLCENIQKQVEIIVEELSLLRHSATVSFPRFTYGNHAATLVQYPCRHPDGSKHSTDDCDIYIMEKQGL
jgi:hypothetical protein